MKNSDKQDILTYIILLCIWVAAFWLITLLVSSCARAEHRQLYIAIKLCKNGECLDRHLVVSPEVNEVQCVYGAFSTVANWVNVNMPTWKVENYRCTYNPEYGL